MEEYLICNLICIFIKKFMKIDFVIPVYNEDVIFRKNAECIFSFLINKNFSFEWSLVFVVNGSSEDFKKKVKIFSLQRGERVCMFIVNEKGKGNAIKKYFNTSHADILVYMDMDLAVSLDNINNLITPVLEGRADLCFGSRMLSSSSRERSLLREFSSKLYIFLSQIMLGHDFSDLQCGFKAITSRAWKEIEVKIKNNFWFFDTELIFYAKKNNYRIVEIPVNWRENRYDERKSKVNIWKDGLFFMINIILLKLRK